MRKVLFLALCFALIAEAAEAYEGLSVAPVPPVVNGNVATGTGPGIHDSGTSLSSLAPLLSPTFNSLGTVTFPDTSTVNSSGFVMANALGMGTNNISNVGQINSSNASGYRLSNGAANCTTPTLLPNRGSTTTGIGGTSGNYAVDIAGTDDMDFGCTTASTWTVPSGAHFTVADATVTLSGLTTGTNADFLCRSSTGVVLIQTSACTISSARFKENIKRFMGSALATIGELTPVTFNLKPTKIPNPDKNATTKQVGLLAENVAKVMPLCAIYEQDMRTPKSYRQECVIAYLVKGMQEQQAEIKALVKH